MSTSENLRRSSRIKARVLELKDENTSSDEDEESMNDIIDSIKRVEFENIKEDVQKPIELFANDDVSGKKLFGFATPSKKDAMTKRASLCHKPSDPKIPSVLPKAKVVLEKVDLSLSKVKSSNKEGGRTHTNVNETSRRYARGLVSSESESVTESSEYSPSEDDSDEDSSESKDNESASNEDFEMKSKAIKQKYIPQSKVSSTPRRLGGKNKPSIIYKDFHMEANEYFETQGEKAITSDRTLECLRNSRLTKEKLEELLSNQNHVTTRHKKNIYALNESYTALFPMWYFIMQEGYTVLLYGLGSKRCIINEFHKSISNHPSLVVNGYFPSLAIKDILDGIIVDLLGLSCPSSVTECICLIENVLKDNPKDTLYLLIHNIDGIMLRSNKAQDILSCLAAIPNLYVLASVDHINAPLLWDHIKRSKFNFFWWDTTTLLPYQEETSYESSLLVQQSGALALSSLHNVFLSLTSNAKSIYTLLANYQLENCSDSNFTGMAFKDLYRAAREGFFVSSDLALRAQLTEFIDHKLVKTKRNIDGVEYLVIPLGDGLLKQFLDEHES